MARKLNLFKLRIVLVSLFLVFAFMMIVARIFQITLLYREMYKIQSSMSSETQALKSELTGKIAQFAADREKIERSLREIEQRLIIAEKTELLKEIGDLRLQHQRLATEVRGLEESLTKLSALEKETITSILNAYEQTAKRQGKFEFIITFVLGVFSSIVASVLYSLAAERKWVPRIRIRRISQKIRTIRKLFRNALSGSDIKPPGPS
jgi:phage host-nuclease inhibitor protein Gam